MEKKRTKWTNNDTRNKISTNNKKTVNRRSSVRSAKLEKREIFWLFAASNAFDVIALFDFSMDEKLRWEQKKSVKEAYSSLLSSREEPEPQVSARWHWRVKFSFKFERWKQISRWCCWAKVNHPNGPVHRLNSSSLLRKCGQNLFSDEIRQECFQ